MIELRCKNCDGLVRWIGDMWVHSNAELGSLVTCRLTRPVATPRCSACGGSGSVARWKGCGCGPGVSHFTDCGTRPPQATCSHCNGIGTEPDPTPVAEGDEG